MLRATLLAALALTAFCAHPALAVPHLARRGQATYYAAGGIGACGFAIGDGACALSGADFDPSTPNGNPNANSLCGKTITVTSGGNSVSCVISDRCEACVAGDVDLQAAQFSQLAPLGAGRIQASWSFAGSAPAPAPSPAPAPVSAPAAPIKSAPVDPPAPQVVADPAPAPSAASAPTSDSIVSAPAPDAPAPATAQGCDPACGSGVHWSTGTCVSGSCVCIAGWTGSACDVPDAGWASSV